MAIRVVNRFAEICVNEHIAALTGHFQLNLQGEIQEYLLHLNALIEEGYSRTPKPYTEETIRPVIESCLRQASLELFKTNIFAAPAIAR